MKFGAIPVATAAGAILAHSQRLADGVLKKGRVLSEADVAALAAAGLDEVVAARLEPGDLAEDAAADRVARAIGGPGLTQTAPFAGRCNLVASADGVMVVDRATVDALNAIDEGLTIATVAPYALVRARQLVATVKVIPFAVHERTVQQWCDAGAALRLAPLVPRDVALIQTRLPGTREAVLDKTSKVTAARLTELGSRLRRDERCDHDAAALAAAIGEAADCDVILISGASAIVDRRDVVPAGLVAAGGTVTHFGMPVDPGNLMLTGSLDERPVLGLPGCARSPKLNGLDWVLWRLFAGLPVDGAGIAGMGVGGLLKEIPSRPQPRQSTAPAPGSLPRVAAVVLAAGQSRRMGATNKLLAPVDGRPMVRHAVDAALASQADPVVVVTGHDAASVRQALDGLDVRFADNRDYGDGLSSSLKAGIAAVGDADGAVVLLGDMPRVTAAHIDTLIAAFDPVEGRGICVPTWQGARGNPVLWGRAYFGEIAAITGDVGAKHLIGANAEAVAEVALDSDAVLVDVDTPDALAALIGD